MLLRKLVENHAISQKFLNLPCGIQLRQILNCIALRILRHFGKAQTQMQKRIEQISGTVTLL
jgi:hypothetical protein